MARTTKRPTVKSIATSIALIVVIVWLSGQVVGIWKKEQIARSAVTHTRAELASLDERRTSLTAGVSELNTPRGQEATVRQNMRVARPGEDVIIVLPQEAQLPAPTLTFWEKVKGYFAQ